MESLIAAAAIAVGLAGSIIATWLKAWVGMKEKRSLSNESSDISNYQSALEPTQVYNISTSGNINFEELPKSEKIIINIQTKSEDINLEYRVAVLEGYIEWMLTNLWC